MKSHKIPDTLVIPYKWTNNENKYTITEANIMAQYQHDDRISYDLPKVKTIIYPNTITKVYGSDSGSYFDNTIKRVVLSENTKEIGDYAFSGAAGMKIENFNATEIGEYAFYFCRAIEMIDLTNVKKLGSYAFNGWESNQKIKVPFASKDASLPSDWSFQWNFNSWAEIIYSDN